MTSGKAKSSYVVRFAATAADQDLLQAIDRALGSQSDKSFSTLCKQALRLMLLPTEPPVTEPLVTMPLIAALEQQLMTLQLQVMQLEQRSREPNNGELERQVQQLTERLIQLEQKLEGANPASVPEEPEIETDPLLSRLAPLLEDF